MGSLIAYSGITTKVKAMERWRISDSQFEEMGLLESVPEAVEYPVSYTHLLGDVAQDTADHLLQGVEVRFRVRQRFSGLF